uniref:Uncharacterized protein n=1 Tax=Stegastes partitus TaxID=144197 RepID=A0A3B4Z6F0_9TELE
QRKAENSETWLIKWSPVCVSPLPSVLVFILITHTSLGETEERQRESLCLFASRLKNSHWCSFDCCTVKHHQGVKSSFLVWIISSELDFKW